MADLFAPKLQSEVAYERPVETPSALGTLARLGESFIDQYGRSQRGGGASGSTSVDPNLAKFAQGLERVESIRDQKGESAALLAERQLAKNFATAGIEFGNEYEDIYTTTTGRQWAGYGRDVQAMMLDEALKDSEVQASYISSFVTLPKDATQDQRIEYAIGQKATINAAADVIARSKAEAGYKWTVQTEAAYAEGIDSFVNVGMGSLIQTTEAGGRVGPQALANLQASWSQQKVGLSRPPNITDQQWKSTQDKLKTVDDMFAMLIKASSSDVLFEEITTAFSNSLLEEGNGSTTSILAAASAIKDPVSLANLLGADTKTFIMDVSKSINLDITQPDLFSGILSQSDATVEGVTVLKELPKEVLDKVSGLSPQEHFDALKASGKLTSIIDPNSLQRPDGKQQFVENAASIGAVMMSMENDEFLSSDFLKQLVANPSFLRNITTLDGVDPEGAAVARSYVVSGLNTELVRQQENLRAVEASSLATWTGTNYTMDLADLEAKVGRNRMLRFNSALQKEYGGDILTGVRDGFRRMYDVTDLVQISGLYNLDAANDRRNSIGVIQGALNILNPIEVPIASDDSNNNLTPSQDAEVTAAINEGPSLGIPLEGIDFESNAPATPAEPAEEIVVTPLDQVDTTVEETPSVETESVDRTLTSDQQNAISDIGEITRASNEPITTRAGTYSFTKTNKAIETSVKNPIKQALLKGAITVETGGAGPVSERPYPYAQAAAIPVWKARMDAVGLGTNATGEEIFNAVYANRNGNGDYASGDGNRYRGRGLIQITGKTTYQGVQDILKGQGIDIDLIGNPDLANDNKYALPVALAFLEYAGLDDTSADTITTNKLNDFINPGASREIAEDRWEEVIDLLELAGMREKGEELELRNEYAAQEKAGTTADGDIGPNSRTAMTNYLTQQGVTIPQNISDDDLVILVNRN
tara:strand:- start:16576 stop:19374 length:2799 start_codon:yes stop_codon:yes gene_type:complete